MKLCLNVPFGHIGIGDKIRQMNRIDGFSHSSGHSVSSTLRTIYHKPKVVVNSMDILGLLRPRINNRTNF